jgi:flagellar biosynthesis protein FlhG
MTNPQPTRVIAIASGKGGVGKTNVSVNLGVTLARQGKEVLLMDADLGLANVDVMLGIKPEFNLSHLFDGERSLEELIVEGPEGLKIIPASSGVSRMADLTPAEHSGLIQAFSELSMPLDVLLVDTAAGVSDSVISFVRASQEVIVVVCDEPASITDAYALIKVLNKDHGITRFHILANMAHSTDEGRELYKKIHTACDRFLDVTLNFLGIIPYDDYLRKAVKKQQPVVLAYPSSNISRSFDRVAKAIQKWPIPGGAKGHLEFFVERLVQFASRAI